MCIFIMEKWILFFFLELQVCDLMSRVAEDRNSLTKCGRGLGSQVEPGSLLLLSS